MARKKEGLLIDFKYKKILLNMTNEDAGSWIKAMLIYATEHREPEPGELGERAQLLYDITTAELDEERSGAE